MYGGCFASEERTAPAVVPAGQWFNPRSEERGERGALNSFGVEEVR